MRNKKVKFFLDDVTDDITVLAHSEECSGIVTNSKCEKCGMHTDGEARFRFDISIQDLKDKSVTLEVPAFKTVGTSLFSAP